MMIFYILGTGCSVLFYSSSIHSFIHLFYSPYSLYPFYLSYHSTIFYLIFDIYIVQYHIQIINYIHTYILTRLYI